ncbi:MAG: hypothetical protein AAF495_29120 [Pseudomonadota bacterium]
MSEGQDRVGRSAPVSGKGMGAEAAAFALVAGTGEKPRDLPFVGGLERR